MHGMVRAVDGVSFEIPARGDARRRRRVGLRQVRHRAVDPAADRDAAGPDRRRAHPLRGQGSARARRARDARDPRQPDRDDLPGADDVAQPGAHRRRPDRRGGAAAPEQVAAEARAARDRDARARRHSGARRARRRVSAPALGRHAAARDDRDGARVRARAADRRRADHRARRHDPGADPRAAASRCSASSAWHPAHHARPRRRRRDLRRGRRDVRRPGRRARRRRARCSRAPRHPYTRGPAALACRATREPTPSTTHGGCTRSRAWCRSLRELPTGCRFADRCPARRRTSAAPRSRRSSQLGASTRALSLRRSSEAAP